MKDDQEIAKDVHAIRDGWGWRLIWTRRRPSKKRYETLNDAIEAYGVGKVEWEQ